MNRNPDLRGLVNYLEAALTNLKSVEIRLEAAIRTAKGLEPLKTELAASAGSANTGRPEAAESQ